MSRATELTNKETEVVTGEVVTPSSALATVPQGPALTLDSQTPNSENPAAVYLAGLGEKSRRVMLSDLNRIAAIVSNGTVDAYGLNWGALRFQHTAAIRAALTAHYTHTGANRMLSALRGVLKAAWRLGQIPTDEYQKAVDVGAVKGESLPAGRAISAGEMRALFGSMRGATDPGTARDAALLAVLYGAGLRRSEAVALTLSDFNQETGALTIRAGKGNKARMAYATNGSRDAITAWLYHRGQEPGPLFVAVKQGGHLEFRHLNNQTVLDILTRRAKAAGIKDVSPHDFRRTFIGDLLDAGADIVTVQKLAGHSQVSTTARYDRRGEVTKQKAAELLFVPFEK